MVWGILKSCVCCNSCVCTYLDWALYRNNSASGQLGQLILLCCMASQVVDSGVCNGLLWKAAAVLIL